MRARGFGYEVCYFTLKYMHLLSFEFDFLRCLGLDEANKPRRFLGPDVGLMSVWHVLQMDKVNLNCIVII